MRVLVTGSRGFLGRHLLRHYEGRAEAAAFDGDVRDAAAWEAQPRADVVFHLAAVSSVPRSMEDPVRAFDVNAGGTLRLLEWARSTEVGRVVLVSSAHVYGRARYSPIDEKHPTSPVSPYGASKLAAEAMALSYHASFGVEAVVVRPFNVYGPTQGRGFLIPDILHQIADGGPLVLGDPRPVRDFTYVDDALSFLDAAATVSGIGGELLNLGSGVGHAVGEVVQTALEVTGAAIQPVYDPGKFRGTETHALVCGNGLARESLGWKPQVDLREGLRRTWAEVSSRSA